MSRIILPGLTAVTLFAFTFAADGQDLKAAAERQKIAAQKLIQNANDAIDASKKQDPSDAKRSLRNMLNRVEDSPDLLPSEKDTLVQRLQARIGVLDRAIRGTASSDDKRPVYRDPDRPKSKTPVADPSSGASGVAKKWTDEGKSTLQAHNDLIRQREAAITRVNMGIEKSHVIPDKDIAFPADWKTRSKRMKDLFGPQLTEKEVKLLKTLNSVLSVDYQDRKFKEVIGHLKDKTGLTIIVDPASLTDLNIDYNDPVTFDAEKASVKSILKQILAQKGLTYIIKEGAIQVMTPEKASKHTVIRSYQVADLVQGDPQMEMMATRFFGPFGAKNLREQNALQLINLIKAAVEPGYWQPDGPGTIVYFDPTKSIMIRASAEMHYQLESPSIFGGR